MVLQIYVPSRMGEAGRGFHNLGLFIRKLVNPQGVKRDELEQRVVEDPDFGRQVAAGIRNSWFQRNPDAPDEEVLAPVAAALDLDPSNTENIAFLTGVANMYPDTLQEGLSRELAQDPKYREMAAREAHAGSIANTAESQAATARADSATIEERQFQAGGGPGYESERRIRESKTGGEQELLKQRMIELGYKEADEIEGAMADYQGFIEANPQYRGVAAAALRNPKFVDYMTSMAELSLRERLSMASSAANPIEQFLALFSIQTGINKELRELTREELAIRESKDMSKEEKDNALAEIAAQRNDVQRYQSVAEQMGLRIPGSSAIAQTRNPFGPAGQRTERMVNEPGRAPQPGDDILTAEDRAVEIARAEATYAEFERMWQQSPATAVAVLKQGIDGGDLPPEYLGEFIRRATAKTAQDARRNAIPNRPSLQDYSGPSSMR